MRRFKVVILVRYFADCIVDNCEEKEQAGKEALEWICRAKAHDIKPDQVEVAHVEEIQ